MFQTQRDYHRRARIRLPNEKLHATLHAIVEAQIALGDETPAGRIAQRLTGEGLDRGNPATKRQPELI
jgi:hypothetical protein